MLELNLSPLQKHQVLLITSHFSSHKLTVLDELTLLLAPGPALGHHIWGPEFFSNRGAILVVMPSHLELWLRSPVLNHFYQPTRGNRPQEDRSCGTRVHSPPRGLSPSGSSLSVTDILARFPEAETSPYTRARSHKRARAGHEVLLTRT